MTDSPLDFGTSPTLLFVEDDPASARLMSEAFSELGLGRHLVVARSEGELLDCLYLRKLDSRLTPATFLILLDMELTSLDAWTLLERIKSDPSLAIIPTIVLANAAEDRDLYMAYAFRANAYVAKPRDYSEYLAFVQGLVAFWFRMSKNPPLS
jgi:CheY-like chemotaxis protein